MVKKINKTEVQKDQSTRKFNYEEVRKYKQHESSINVVF